MKETSILFMSYDNISKIYLEWTKPQTYDFKKIKNRPQILGLIKFEKTFIKHIERFNYGKKIIRYRYDNTNSVFSIYNNVFTPIQMFFDKDGISREFYFLNEKIDRCAYQWIADHNIVFSIDNHEIPDTIKVEFKRRFL